MGKIILVSVFLGAGKTTFIRRLLNCTAPGQKTALLENEFGTCSVDDILLQRRDLPVSTLASGCICCSLSGAFDQAIRMLERSYHPDLLVIEPSGLAELSVLLNTCRSVSDELGIAQVRAITIVDAEMHQTYVEDMGMFYLDQIRHADAIICSKLDLVSPQTAGAVYTSLLEENPDAHIWACPWDALDVSSVLEQVSGEGTSCVPVSGHGHVHTAELFTSEVFHPYRPRTAAQWEEELMKLSDPARGQILRAKGFLPLEDGAWIQADCTPGHVYLHPWGAPCESILTVIGRNMNRSALSEQFEKIES